MDSYRFKVITDPVHGDIGLSELEVRLVDSPSFQRLRRLKQLGLASYVYPGANHTRFEHSLGVFHIMARIIDLLIRRGRIPEHHRQMLRAAALLHDIGHYPYSHLLEQVDRHQAGLPWLERSVHPAADRRSPYPDHEELGKLIVTRRKDICGPLRRAKLLPDEVAQLIRGQHKVPLFNQLIHSSLDVDRIDYLMRDSLHVGVPYGRVDVHYLLNNLDVTKDGTLVVSYKAATAAEHLLIARYFMSRAVYLHKTVFGFEAMLRQVLRLLRKEDRLYRDGHEVEKLVRDENAFLDFNDGYIDDLIDDIARDDHPGPLPLLCRSLRLRRPPKLVKEVSVLSESGHRLSEEYTVFRTRREDHLPGLAERHRIPPECWIVEDPKDVTFETFGPIVPLAEAGDIRQSETSGLIKVRERDGSVRNLVEAKDSILRSLSTLRFQMARLYVVLDGTPNEVNRKFAAIRRDVQSWCSA